MVINACIYWHYVLSILVNSLNALTHLILSTTSNGRCLELSHFAERLGLETGWRLYLCDKPRCA